jgi:Oxidoreductase family, C-terminal alpha/beta domain/Oxidoreductase family, NAD-binding Rossmann fold
MKRPSPTLRTQQTKLPQIMKSVLNVSRRRFLHRTAAAIGAAIAAPSIVPASALGRNGLIPPSERVAMGFIGVGGQGGGHLLGGAWTYVAGGYAGRKDVQVLAVCDVWRDRRDKACQKVNDHYAEAYGKGSYKACEAYSDFRHVLDRPDIDAVLIASPAHWHATMAAMAAVAGKDIYCEKPTAVTVSESQAVLAAVRRYGRVYQAGTQQRSEYGGKFRLACEFVRSGRIGKLQAIYAYRDGGAVFWPQRFGPAKPVPEGLDWDLYLGPAPWLPYDGNVGSHRFDIGELNWGQHHYDIVQWAAAADETGPVELFMEGDRSGYKYASGVVVHGTGYPNEPVGNVGGACFVGTAGRIAVDRDALVSDPPDIVREPLRPDEVHLYRSTSHSGNFLECVRTRKKPICDAEVAHRAASALLLGGVAKQLRRTLKWDPQAEKFIKDDEANRMLSIAKRPPWCI